MGQQGKQADDLSSYYGNVRPAPLGSPGTPPPGSRSFSEGPRYPALNFVISVQSAAAWVLAGLIAVASLAAFSRSPMAGIVGLIVAFLVWVVIMVGAEILQLFIRLEENTRPR